MCPIIIQKILSIVTKVWYYFLMKYENIIKGKFIERPNRFVAVVEVEGDLHRVHVKNTGRCRELLVPGAIVYLEDFIDRMGSRKMRFSLVGVEKVTDEKTILINMDSQAPNKVVKEALEDGKLQLPGLDKLSEIKWEAKYGDSRLDFYVKDINGKEAYAEVKGVTLENKGLASFPDAPTERGIKHLYELLKAKEEGMEAYAIFVIQMKGVISFSPNDERHKAFGDALRDVASKGVHVIALDCKVTEDTLQIDNTVNVNL